MVTIILENTTKKVFLAEHGICPNTGDLIFIRDTEYVVCRKQVNKTNGTTELFVKQYN